MLGGEVIPSFVVMETGRLNRPVGRMPSQVQVCSVKRQDWPVINLTMDQETWRLSMW